MSQSLIEKLRTYIEFNEDEERFIDNVFRVKHFAKGEHFLLAGDVCREAAFIESGVFRFYLNTGERDATYYFAAENEFICDYPSFLPQRPSSINIQALEAAEIRAISFDDLQRFYRQVTFGERFGRLIAEEIFVDSIQQLTSFYQDKPAVRYQNFVHRFSQLVQRLPQYYIASYVGIEPQSLSRIRRRFLSKK
ncbi:MAG TPA: Crp/Fnr family transcriptional regulator [Pyrinomonadaceae bacterium]|nr:Crp/Fnr family transcriptional regulator [Pyrinomonadaceae bacterium]